MQPGADPWTPRGGYVRCSAERKNGRLRGAGTCPNEALSVFCELNVATSRGPLPNAWVAEGAVTGRASAAAFSHGCTPVQVTVASAYGGASLANEELPRHDRMRYSGVSATIEILGRASAATPAGTHPEHTCVGGFSDRRVGALTGEARL
jgi:hypothetical protein